MLKGQSGTVVCILALDKEKEKKSFWRVYTADSEGNVFFWKGESRATKKLSLLHPITSMCMTPTNEGILWIGTKTDLYIHELQNTKIHKKELTEGVTQISLVNDHIWVLGEKGMISVYGMDLLPIGPDAIEGVSGNCFVEVNKSHAWIGDNTGCISILDTQSLSFIKKVETNGGPVTCLLTVDSQVWSGSTDNVIRRWFFS